MKRGEILLLWNVNGYADLRGGYDYCIFQNKEEVLKKVEKLLEDERCEILQCIECLDSIEFEAVEVVKKWKIKE